MVVLLCRPKDIPRDRYLRNVYSMYASRFFIQSSTAVFSSAKWQRNWDSVMHIHVIWCLTRYWCHLCQFNIYRGDAHLGTPRLLDPDRSALPAFPSRVAHQPPMLFRPTEMYGTRRSICVIRDTKTNGLL